MTKAKRQAFFKLNNCEKNFSIACAEQQSFIILNSCNFACKHKKITEILSFRIFTNFSFFDLYECFFGLFLVYFAAEADIVFNLFLNFEQKWTSSFRKSFLWKEQAQRQDIVTGGGGGG